MREICRHVWQLQGFPPDAINVYLIDDVLVDAASRWGGSRILRQTADRSLSMVALTHVHPDHQGAAKLISERLGIPLACHSADIPAMQGERPMQPDNMIVRGLSRLLAGPPCGVTKALDDGDEIAGFRVIHAPGHTDGHIILFRDEDKIAIVGDLLNGVMQRTPWPRLIEPPRFLTANPVENRKSIRRLAELSPRVMCFGHGPPLFDMRPFDRLMKTMPSN